MSSEVLVVSWCIPDLEGAVRSLSDPGMVKCLDDRVQGLRCQIDELCRKRRWTVQWLRSCDPESLDDEAKVVLEALSLIEYLEYLRRGYP